MKELRERLTEKVPTHGTGHNYWYPALMKGQNDQALPQEAATQHSCRLLPYLAM